MLCLLAKLFYLSTESPQERNGTYTSLRGSPGMIMLSSAPAPVMYITRMKTTRVKSEWWDIRGFNLHLTADWRKPAYSNTRRQNKKLKWQTTTETDE